MEPNEVALKILEQFKTIKSAEEEAQRNADLHPTNPNWREYWLQVRLEIAKLKEGNN